MNRPLRRRTVIQAAGAALVAGHGVQLAGDAHAAGTPAKGSGTTANKVVTHPKLEGVPVNPAFGVRVRPVGGRWQAVNTYGVTLSLIDAITGANSFPVSTMAAFDFSGTVEVEVKYNKPGRVDRTRVRPASSGITPEVRGNTLRFTLTRPGNLVVQLDDDVFDCLHLLANPLEQDPPADGDEGVMYFGPGLHTPASGELRVPSDTTVYLAPGAVLQARVIFEGVRNSRLIGHGVLSRSKSGAIFMHDCENIEIDGITVLNPRYENLRIAECRDLRIKNMRAFTHQGWGDGIQLYCSENVTIDGCFLRTSDDSIALYTHRWDFYGDTRNITVKNCSLWADVAHPINMAVHGNPDPAHHEVLENLTFENIDILDHREPQVNAQGCIAINAGDGNLVRNARFDGIRVEDFRWGHLVHLQVSFNPRWNTAPGRGIESVYIKDLSYHGENAGLSLLIGLDSDHVIKDVTFENLRINGRTISENTGKPAWYQASDGVPMFVNDHVRNLRFLTT